LLLAVLGAVVEKMQEGSRQHRQARRTQQARGGRQMAAPRQVQPSSRRAAAAAAGSNTGSRSRAAQPTAYGRRCEETMGVKGVAQRRRQARVALYQAERLAANPRGAAPVQQAQAGSGTHRRQETTGDPVSRTQETI